LACRWCRRRRGPCSGLRWLGESFWRLVGASLEREVSDGGGREGATVRREGALREMTCVDAEAGEVCCSYKAGATV